MKAAKMADSEELFPPRDVNPIGLPLAAKNRRRRRRRKESLTGKKSGKTWD